ncbi:hypothetical protein FOZ63_004441, partial [Perkinsus olseni]
MAAVALASPIMGQLSLLEIDPVSSLPYTSKLDPAHPQFTDIEGLWKGSTVRLKVLYELEMQLMTIEDYLGGPLPWLQGIEDPLYQSVGTINDSKLEGFWHGLLEYISDVYTLFVHLKEERISVDEFEGLLRAESAPLTGKGTRKIVGEYKVIIVAPNNRFMYYLDGLNGLYPVSRLIPKKSHPLRSLLDAAAKPQRSALASALGNIGPRGIAITSLKPGDWFGIPGMPFLGDAIQQSIPQTLRYAGSEAQSLQVRHSSEAEEWPDDMCVR